MIPKLVIISIPLILLFIDSTATECATQPSVESLKAKSDAQSGLLHLILDKVTGISNHCKATSTCDCREDLKDIRDMILETELSIKSFVEDADKRLQTEIDFLKTNDTEIVPLIDRNKKDITMLAKKIDDAPSCKLVSSGCPTGWIKFKGSCLGLVKQSHLWNDALSLCTAMHADLMYVETKDELDYMSNLARTHNHPFWLGGTDMFIEGHWTWIATGKPFTHTNWLPGQPQTSEYIAGVDTDGTWHDWGNANRFWFVCKRKERIFDCHS